MSLTRASGAAILTPEQIATLIIEPLAAQSVGLAASTVIQCSGSSLRVPTVGALATAAWTQEGQEIAPSDAVLDEVDIQFFALKALSILSNELAQDSSPAAVGVIGDSILRDLLKRVDSAFFGTSAAYAPAGLGSLPTTGASHINVLAATDIASLDVFQDAILNAEARYVAPSDVTFVAAPATVGQLLKLKESTTSARPLITADVTIPSLRTIGGVALVSSPAVAANVIWAVPRTRVVVGVRQDADVQVDSSAYFSSDRSAVRVVSRLGWSVTDVTAVSKITLTVTP